MAITREKKKEIISELKRIFSESESVAFCNFHGLSVKDATEVRNGLREKGVGYYVAKKSLTRKALEEAEVEGNQPEFVGELSIVYGKDATDSAREIYEFQKKFDNQVSIVGGIFAGEYRDKEGMVEVAQIPSLQVLRGQFVNLINSPIQGFAIALNAIAEKKEAVN